VEAKAKATALNEALTRTGTGRYIWWAGPLGPGWAPRRRRLPAALACRAGCNCVTVPASACVLVLPAGCICMRRSLSAGRGQGTRDGFVRPVCRVLTPASVQALLTGQSGGRCVAVDGSVLQAPGRSPSAHGGAVPIERATGGRGVEARTTSTQSAALRRASAPMAGPMSPVAGQLAPTKSKSSINQTSPSRCHARRATVQCMSLTLAVPSTCSSAIQRRACAMCGLRARTSTVVHAPELSSWVDVDRRIGLPLFFSLSLSPRSRPFMCSEVLNSEISDQRTPRSVRVHVWISSSVRVVCVGQSSCSWVDVDRITSFFSLVSTVTAVHEQ
jgi:hypothetical protein